MKKTYLHTSIPSKPKSYLVLLQSINAHTGTVVPALCPRIAVCTRLVRARPQNTGGLLLLLYREGTYMYMYMYRHLTSDCT